MCWHAVMVLIPYLLRRLQSIPIMINRMMKALAVGGFVLYVYNLINAISELTLKGSTATSAMTTSTTAPSTCAPPAPVCCSFCDVTGADITDECAGCIAESFSEGGCCPLFGAADAGDATFFYRIAMLVSTIVTLLTFCVHTYYLFWKTYPKTWSK